MQIKKILQQIDKIPFSYKTSILIFIIIGGMISIIVLSQLSIYTIKNDFNILFEKRTKPIIKLEAIKDIYKINIDDTLYEMKKNNLTIKQSKEIIYLGKELIDNNWNNYITIRTSKKYEPFFVNTIIKKFFTIGIQNQNNILQDGIMENINNKKETIDNKINKIFLELKKKNTQKAYTLIDKVSINIDTINVYITNLTNYDLNIAINERINTQKIFNTLSIILNISIIFVFSLSILLSVIIIKNFKKQHSSLEDAVNEKTKELLALNESLEIRIKNEVANSRKKDMIMFQQSRLASMGEMISNIAHQWRQPLGSLIMIIQGFQTKMELGKLTPEFMQEKVNDALLLGNNMSNTLEDFQDFFKPNKEQERFSLKNCIEHSFNLSKYLLEKEEIKFYLISKDDIYMNGYYNELSHVFLNIISNAKDALSDKKIKKFIEVLIKKSKDNIRINIIDNGGGIDKEILPHIFEPYYTTKYKSSGTGIGLYMSKQIIEKHMQGSIDCKNIYYKIKNQNFENCVLFTITIPLNKGNTNVN